VKLLIKPQKKKTPLSSRQKKKKNLIILLFLPRLKMLMKLSITLN